MKTIDNYTNFDIKVSKNGKIFIYSDSGLSEYMPVRLGEAESVEEAKAKIDRFWAWKKEN